MTKTEITYTEMAISLNFNLKKHHATSF
jgi:hypothetical protein